jgi:16S rRNA (adenine1518-N6/adenine1519-N6)-dimethyltransferase
MEMLTPATVRALLTEHDIRPKKSLGQHFLADPNTARRIARLAEVEPGDDVLEIGPGLGSLTLALIERGAHVRAVELDPELAHVAETVTGIEVRVGDALTVAFDELLAGEPDWSCVSNLPYNVAVPVVVRILEEAAAVTRIVVLVQREVAERLAAAPGGPEYGAVSVKVTYYAEAALLGTVPASVFVPRPRVESALVRLQRRAAPPVAVPSESDLFALVRSGFAQRRKMLRSSLRPVLGERAVEVLEAAGIAPTARAEALGLAEWAALARSATAAA